MSNIDELVNEILRHREFLVSSGELTKRHRDRARFELLETVEAYMKNFVHGIDEGDYLESMIDDLLQGKTNPQFACKEIADRFASDIGRAGNESRGDSKS